MALSISPGYDFTVNEVPTNAKLRSMLDGVVIKNIPRASVDGSLSGIAYGWLTGATMQTLANEGDLLYDLSGKLWVNTANGVCGLYYAGQGGYDTVRFKTGAPLDGGLTNPTAVDNFYGRLESLTAPNVNWGEIYYRPATSQSQNGYFMHQVTTPSGDRVRIMLTGTRRATVLWSTGTWPRTTRTGNDAWFCAPIEKDVGAANEWKITQFPHFNDSLEGLGPKYGICGSEEDNDVRAPAYTYGLEMMVI